MKNSIVCILLLFSGSIIGQNLKSKQILLGEVTKTDFSHSDFNWFSKNYEDYLTNDKITKKLKKSLKGYTIKAFFGSWCGDSKRNLPVFYKVLEESNFSHENLTVIAVDRKKEAYKQSPGREEKGLNIHRVPTFIIYKDGIEVNRIVEYPKTTFERDLLKITTSKNYVPKYKAVTLLSSLLKKPKDSLQLLESKLISFIPEIAEGVKELNTYGFVKLRANLIDEAEYIFKLNAKMYPNHYVPYHSLGVYYFEKKEYQKALKNLYKSLSIYTENTKAKELIQKLKDNNLITSK